MVSCFATNDLEVILHHVGVLTPFGSRVCAQMLHELARIAGHDQPDSVVRAFLTVGRAVGASDGVLERALVDGFGSSKYA